MAPVRSTHLTPKLDLGCGWKAAQRGLESGRFGPFSHRRLSRKREMNPLKKKPWDSSAENRRMFPAMDTDLHAFCGRTQLTLAIALAMACAANVVLVCVWL